MKISSLLKNGAGLGNIHTHPTEGHSGEVQCRESKKPNFFKGSMKLNWNNLFRGVLRGQTKHPSVGEVRIFSGTTLTVGIMHVKCVMANK